MSGPARPGPWPRYWEAYISETVDTISILSSQGARSIQTTLITVEFGFFLGGVTQAGIACRVEGVNNWTLSCNSEMAGPIVIKFVVSLGTK